MWTSGLTTCHILSFPVSGQILRDFQIFKITSLSSESGFPEKKVQKLPKRDKHKLPGTTAGVGGPADSHFMHTTQAAIPTEGIVQLEKMIQNLP